MKMSKCQNAWGVIGEEVAHKLDDKTTKVCSMTFGEFYYKDRIPVLEPSCKKQLTAFFLPLFFKVKFKRHD